MTDNQVQEIKDKIDIVSLINEYIPLKKAGKNYRALCPFHQEKTPSFMVSSELQIFKCFGCGKGGDVFSFLKEIEGMDFGDSLTFLADKVGIKLKRYKKSKREYRRERLLEINHLAAEVFHHLLTSHKAGKEAYRYLRNRGITVDTIEKFGLGYSPNSWEFMGNYLLSKKYTLSEVISAGLAISKETGRGFYDRYRGRVMFPLKDVRGSIVGFAGRTLIEGQPKYINSPETEVFSKSSFLYGLNLSKTEIKSKNRAIVVEGLFDVIAPFQAGIKNIVASQGTALTLGQIKLLHKITDTLAFCYDTDKAGDAATKRGIALAQSQDLNLQVVLLPSGKDPDECVRENVKSFSKAIAEAVSVNDFYFESAFSKYSVSSAVGKKSVSQELLPVIKAIANPVEKAHYIKKLAEGIGVSEEIIQESLSTLEASSKKSNLANLREQTFTKEIAKEPAVLEEYILALLFKAPLNVSQSIVRKIAQADFTEEGRISLFTELKNHISGRKRPFEIKKFRAKLGDDLKPLAERLYLWDLDGLEEDEEAFKGELESAFKLLKNKSIRRSLRELSLRIREAEKKKDLKKREKLQQKFQELAEKLP